MACLANQLTLDVSTVELALGVIVSKCGKLTISTGIISLIKEQLGNINGTHKVDEGVGGCSSVTLRLRLHS